jgi:hypothetical protein
MIEYTKLYLILFFCSVCAVLGAVSFAYHGMLHSSFEVTTDTLGSSVAAPSPSSPEPLTLPPTPNGEPPEPSPILDATPLPSSTPQGDSSSSNTQDDDLTSVITARCDVDGNGRIEPRDVGLVKYFFGCNARENRYSCYDVNRDGSINFDDVELIQSNYSK